MPLTPQSNFYRYVIQARPPPRASASFYAQVQAQVYESLESLQARWRDSSVAIATLHAPYRHAREIRDNVTHPVHETLSKLQKFKDSRELPDMLRMVHDQGAKCLFKVQYDPDLDHPHRNILYLRAENDSHVPHNIQAVAKALGVKEAKLITGYREVAQAARPHRLDPRELLDTRRTFYPLDARLDWHGDLTWLNFYFARDLPGRVAVEKLAYYRALGQLFRRLPVATWRAYLLSVYLQFVRSFFQDTREEDDTKDPHHRTRLACHAWWHDASRVYLRAFASRLRPVRSRVEMMVTHIHAALRRWWHSVAQLTDLTREGAVAKVDNMRVLVGWASLPGRSIPASVLKACRYFDEYICLGFRSAQKLIYNQANTPVHYDRWRYMPWTEVNAFYSRELNTVFLPCALFHRPFWYDDEKDASAENLGGLGAIVAHEMAHAFDPQSRHIDAAGRLRNWWQIDDNRAYEASVHRLAQLYDQRRPRRVNGALTVCETYADLLGLWVAYNALPKPVTRETELHFFQAFARTQYSRASAEEYEYAEDNHPPAEVRVNKPLSTFPPFLHLYQVKPRDKMYTIFENRPRFGGGPLQSI